MAKSLKSNAGASKSAPANTRTAKAAAPTKAKPAARTTAQPRTTTRGGHSSEARREAAPLRAPPRPAAPLNGDLRPIRKQQSRDQIIASASAAAGIEPRAGRVFTQSLMTTLKRHVIRGATGYVPIPFLDAAILRGTQAARKARTMVSGLTKLEVKIPERRASPVPRFRAHRALREAVARV